MTDVRNRLVEAARSMEGTPFHHAQRTPGRRGGVDCSGLLICALRAIGIRPFDEMVYAREVDPRQLREGLEANAVEIQPDDAVAGDALAFWFTRRGRMQHVALMTGPDDMIHTHARATGGMVREEPITDFWRTRIVSAWRLREVA